MFKVTSKPVRKTEFPAWNGISGEVTMKDRDFIPGFCSTLQASNTCWRTPKKRPKNVIFEHQMRLYSLFQIAFSSLHNPTYKPSVLGKRYMRWHMVWSNIPQGSAVLALCQTLVSTNQRQLKMITRAAIIKITPEQLPEITLVSFAWHWVDKLKIQRPIL